MSRNPPPPNLAWTPGDDPDDVPWDQERADLLLGKYALVGVTYTEADDTVLSHAQYHGRIVSVDRKTGIKIECEGIWAGHSMGLPPALSAFNPTELPEYRLNSTGEVVTNADVMTTWTVAGPIKPS
jgi:hypothetical protein